MTQLIAVKADALDQVLDRLEWVESRLASVTIQPRPEWASVAEYAAQKGVTIRTVNNWINAGKLETRGAGKMKEVKI